MNKKMITKILMGAGLAAVAIPIFIVGGIPLYLLIGAVVILASYEIAGLRDESKANWPMTILIAIAVFVMSQSSEQMLVVFMGVWLILLFVISMFDSSMTSDQVVYTFTMSMILTFAVFGVLRIYSVGMKGAGVLFVGLACYVCDTGAYFFGSFFGKHKMIPRVSPNKTWEGAIGGYLLSAIVATAFGIFVSETIPNDLAVVGGLILPAVAEIGDLAFSAIKRRWGMKDFGSVFPEHGGILDRIDSLLFCLMAFNFLMIIWGIA